MHSLPSLCTVCVGLLCSAPAVADSSRSSEERERDTLLYAGTALLLGGVAMDATFWAVVDTTDDAAPWAWHLVPLAGPIIGFTDVDTLCPGGDALHGCSLPKGMAYVGTAASLALQTAGLVLLGTQAFSSDGGDDSAQRLRPPLHVVVSKERMLLSARWSL